MDFLIRRNTHHVIEVFVSKRFHNEAKAAKKAKKPLLNPTEHWELNSSMNNFEVVQNLNMTFNEIDFIENHIQKNSSTNMVAKVDIDDLKI